MLVLSGNEVYWEPGCEFDDSRWVVVEQARPLDVVKEMPGFIEGDQKADATAAESPAEDAPAAWCLAQEYLERPSLKARRGAGW